MYLTLIILSFIVAYVLGASVTYQLGALESQYTDRANWWDEDSLRCLVTCFWFLCDPILVVIKINGGIQHRIAKAVIERKALAASLHATQVEADKEYTRLLSEAKQELVTRDQQKSEGSTYTDRTGRLCYNYSGLPVYEERAGR